MSFDSRRHASTVKAPTHTAVGDTTENLRDACEFGDVPAADCHVQVTSWCLPSDMAVRSARELLRAQLDGHVTDQAVLDDLEVIVSELATNARLHTDGPCEIHVLHHAGLPVVCEIADASDGLDMVADHLRRFTEATHPEAITSIDWLAESGRGLHIVAALSQGHCGVHPTTLRRTGQTGKSVWFGIPADPAPAAARKEPLHPCDDIADAVDKIGHVLAIRRAGSDRV